jgi:integrase
MAKSTWGTEKAGTAVKLTRGLRIVQRVTESGEGIWYKETLVDHRPVRVSLGTSDRKEAIRKASTETEEGSAPRTFLKSKAPDVLTLDKALDEYRKWSEKRHRESTSIVMLATAEKFVEFAGEDLDTRAVSKSHVLDFLAKKEGRSPIYIGNEFGRIRAFLRKTAKNHKGAVDLSCLDVTDDLPEDDSTGREIPDETTAKNALRKLSSHDWMGEYVTVLYETGMRPGELLAVRGVDLDGSLLRIEPWGTWKPKSKWSKRTIELNAVALRILKDRKEKLFDKRAPIFGLATGQMRNVKHVSKQYRGLLGEDPEFKLCNLYVWKHLFCSFHASPGAQFMELQQLAVYIGHGPGSTRLLERWYANRDAMRRGAPPALTEAAKDGKVIELRKANE